jgi:hypothetical protein
LRGDAETIRARRHPLAILGVWAWQTVVAWFAGWPAACLVRAAYGNDPRGDAPLWLPGSDALLDFLWRDWHGVSAAARAAAVVLVTGAVAGLVPMAALMVAIAGAGEGPKVGFARGVGDALRAVPAMLLLLVTVTAAQALVVGAGALAGAVAETLTHAALGEAHAQELSAALCLPFLALAAAIGVTHDLARAAVVSRAAGGMRALVVGAKEFAAAPVSLGWSWAWRAIAALAPVIVAGAAASRLGGRGGAALLLLALLHQAAVLARVALRASWLATALRRVPAQRTP